MARSAFFVLSCGTSVTVGRSISLLVIAAVSQCKHGESATPSILPWKRVLIDIRSVTAEETRQQIQSFISQKRLEGLDVDTFLHAI